MRILALIFGVVFLSFGIAGFIPDLLLNNRLMEIFRVNIWLNLLHLVIGFFGLIVCFLNTAATRIYFQIIGVLLAILGILGFIYGNQEIFGVFASNNAGTWLHVIAAIGALILGYGAND